MSAEAIDYVKKPTMEFIKESWKLMRRCTKPDRNGARRVTAAPAQRSHPGLWAAWAQASQAGGGRAAAAP